MKSLLANGIAPELVTQLRNYASHRPDRTIVRYVRKWNDPIDGTVDIASWPEFEALVRSHS